MTPGVLHGRPGDHEDDLRRNPVAIWAFETESDYAVRRHL